MLIVVEHRNFEQLAQPLLDDEALRRLDVFEIDPAKGWMQKAHAVDEFVDVAGVDFEIDRIDVGKAFEQRRLALHDWLGGERAEIAEAENRGAVRNYRYEIALGRVIEGGARIALDMQARKGHARRIRQRQIALGGQRLGRRDRQLSGAPAAMEQESLVLGRVSDPGVHAACRS